MQNDATCVLLNGLLSLGLGLFVLLAAFRLVGRRIGIFIQVGVFAAALAAILLSNAYWWKFPSLQLHGYVPWLALILFWGGLLYFYISSFATIGRDGGPTLMLFQFIDESPSASRTRQEILDYFCNQPVLSARIGALVASDWLKQTARGHHVVTLRSRLMLFLIDGWTRLLGYPWGG